MTLIKYIDTSKHFESLNENRSDSRRTVKLIFPEVKKRKRAKKNTYNITVGHEYRRQIPHDFIMLSIGYNTLLRHPW